MNPKYFIKIDDEISGYWRATILLIDLITQKPAKYEIFRLRKNIVAIQYEKISFEDLVSDGSDERNENSKTN